MRFLRKVLPCIESAPEECRVDDSDVYPLHMLDDSKGCRDFFLHWTMQFNDVLDAHQLHQSLSKLLEIGDWRKLGGRFHYKANGKLELRVPKQFTHKRPAVGFSCDATSFGLSIKEHPLACRLHKATAEASLQHGVSEFECFGVKPGVPRSIKESIAQDAPQLFLHITTFNDATLVGLSFCHTLMDVLGLQALMQSWSLVLAGRDDEVPPLLGARNDIMRATIDESMHPKLDDDFVHATQRLRGPAFLGFFLRYFWDVFKNPVVETRMLYLPKSALDTLRNQAMESIRATSQGQLEKVPFLSEADILTAWLARIVALSESHLRPLSIIHAINARFRLAPVLKLPEKGVFVQNMVLASTTILSPQLARGPMGTIALENRRQLGEKTTTQQMAMLLQMLQKDAERGREPEIVLPCGKPSSVPVVINNISKIKLMKAVDFKPAVLREGDPAETRQNPTGTIVYHYLSNLNAPIWKRSCFVVLDKDYQGGNWLILTLTQKSSLTIKQAISDLKSCTSSSEGRGGCKIECQSCS